MEKETRKGLDVKSMNLRELETELAGEKPFRAGQMYEWMHVKLARSFDEMTNLPKALREECKERFIYTALRPVRVQESKIDGTKKFLFALSDGSLVESVWMQYRYGNSVCISSQVGLQDGLCFLCFRAGGTGTQSDSRGDAGPGLCHYIAHGRAGEQCGSHGYRGAAGQLR